MKTIAIVQARRDSTLRFGLLLVLCVYYLNYSATFDEGKIEDASPLTMVIRLLSVVLIVWSLRPFKLPFDTSASLAVVYIASAASFLLSIGVAGSLNDGLFFNTLLQLPVLIALSATNRYVDYARCFRFIGIILVLQVIVDTAITVTDASLWLSEAFVGGVGNPSSFGFLCTLLVAFYVFHPQAGSWRGFFVLILSVGALMSKSLFAVIGLGIVYFFWMVCSWQRIIAGSLTIGVAAVSVVMLLGDVGEGQMSFILHKLRAAGALFGLVDYDVESSDSVSLRVQMHDQTFAAIANDPFRLLYGHLESTQYWPMDSQLLAYLGSFGILMLIAFAALHLLWLWRAIGRKKLDGGFAFFSLMLFGLIFATNRILDYFPIATIYFILISMAVRTNKVREPIAG